MDKKLTTAFGAPVDDNQNIATAGERGAGVAAEHLVS
jgi:catalase